MNLLPATREAEQKIDLLNLLGFYYTPISVEEAERYVEDAMQKANELNYKEGLAFSFKSAGLIQYVRSDYNLAMQYSYQALKVYEELNDRAGKSKVLNNLAMIMNAQMEYGRGYTFSLESLKLKRQIGDSIGVANSMLTMAQYFGHTGEYDKALAYCKTATNRFQSFNYDIGYGHALFSMGEIYLLQKKYPFASSYYHDALRIARRSQDHIQVVNINKQLGKLFLQSQRLDSAYSYLHRTIRLAQSKNNRNSEVEATQYLADYFIKTGEIDSALYYTQVWATIERSMHNTQKRDQIATLQRLYDFDKQEQELTFQRKIVRRQYIAIAGVTLILILAILFAFRIFALNKSNQKAKEDLIELNAEIKKINENLEAIVQERTEEIKSQNQKLIDYTFFTAHEIRGPLARILGLIELAKIKELSEEDKKQIMVRLEDASNELDDIIRKVSRKLESSKR